MPNLASLFKLPKSVVALITRQNPALHPPNLRVMQSDIDNVISSIAGRYKDPTCPPLNYQDLVAEGNLKLAQLCDKGLITRLPRNPWPTRAEWFKFFKTVVNNHVKGLVHKNRGTIKRTGHSIPTKEERNNPMRESNKPIELSIDDPETHLQLSEQSCDHSAEEHELMAHVKAKLTPIENLVLEQLLQPNNEAWFWAVYDSFRGGKIDRLKVCVKYEHQAKGLGIDLEQFLLVQQRLKEKYMLARDEQADVKYNLALQSLSTIFNLQVPDSIKVEKDTIARMFTMVARRECEKVNDDVVEMLKLIGARPPMSRADFPDACFGVMFDAENSVCARCGAREACQADALTHGIDGTIAYSPKLMGSKTVRTMVLTGKPAQPNDESAPELCVVHDSDNKIVERDDEIMSFIRDSFVERRSKNNTYLDYKEVNANVKARYIFWVERKHRLVLRFCNPSDALKKVLVKHKNKGFYLPDNLSAVDAIKLINRHARERMLS